MSRVLEHRDDDFSALVLLTILVRRAGFIILCVLVFAAGAVISTLRTERTYTSSAALITQSQRGSANFAGLAAQIGINVPPAEAGQSPAFYVALLRTNEILRTIVQIPLRYYRTGKVVEAPLTQIFDIPATAQADRRIEAAVGRLRGALNAGFDARTGIINISVNGPNPEVAQQTVGALVGALSRYNVQTRKSQASAERLFTERRLKEVADSLNITEDKLRTFLEENRVYDRSPELHFRYDRLAGELTRRQEIYNQLSRAYEQAKIDEVRETPTLTVVDSPTLPLHADARGGMKRTIVAGVLGFLVGILAVLGWEYGRQSSRDEYNVAYAGLVYAIRDLVPWHRRSASEPKARTPR